MRLLDSIYENGESSPKSPVIAASRRVIEQKVPGVPKDFLDEKYLYLRYNSFMEADHGGLSVRRISRKEDHVPLSISLKACNPDRNVFRFYTLSLDRDLFNKWMLTCGYGRIGCRGTLKTYSHLSYDEGKRLYDRNLKRRLNAKSRIGCDYKEIK